MLGRTDRRLRHLSLLALFVCMAVALSVRLAYWQIGQGDDLRSRADTQMQRPAAVFVQRGDITDRRGTLLATTAYRDLLAAHPDLLAAESRAPVARRLAELLGYDAEQADKLVQTFESGVPYTIVSKRLTSEQSQLVRAAVNDGELAALSLEPRPVRFYPNTGGAPRTTLASQLLGFVTDDGEGRYGIEQYNHALLAGLPTGTAALEAAVPAPAGPGEHLSLTIDASLQLRIEKELYAVWVANQAERVSAVVMNPHTGEVLAWASVPGYDANSYMQVARQAPERFVDPLASQIYEPGSVMKTITAAAALEARLVSPETIIEDERFLEFGGYRVHNSDKRSMGALTFAQVLAYSRNVPTAKIAAGLGDDTATASARLFDLWQRLGLGRATGIELSSEARGMAVDPQVRRWAPVDLANRSFGQGVALTPVQLAVAYSTMINGGHQVPAHLVAAGDEPPAPGEQVLDAGVSRTVREMLVNNVTSVEEVAAKTLINGYTVGGKTGTAQIWNNELGAWDETDFNYTFCGFIGDGEPDLVIVVTINRPALTVEKRRLMVPKIESYELFRRVAQTSISVLDLPPDEAAEPAEPTEPAEPAEPADATDPPEQPSPTTATTTPGPSPTDRASSDPAPPASPAAAPAASPSASPTPRPIRTPRPSPTPVAGP
jgi:cell division protein FtsI/penicillin-binding protein 2